MLGLVTGPDTRRRRTLGSSFMAGCSGTINRNSDIQTDLVELASNTTVSEYMRSRSLLALRGTRCPLPSTVNGVKHIAENEDRQSSVKETATLMLGALLRKNRECIKSSQKPLASAEEDLNHDLVAALKARDTGRARIILMAMDASGSGRHLPAIQQALQRHGALLRTTALKASSESALNSIGKHDASHDQKLRSALLRQLQSDESDFTELATSVQCPVSKQYETPILCYAINVPAKGDLKSRLAFELGMGVGLADERPAGENNCQTYLFAKSSVEVEIAMKNSPLETLFRPLVLDPLSLTTQAKFTGEEKIGAGLFVFGFPVKAWGSGIIEPATCDPEESTLNEILSKLQDMAGDSLSPFHKDTKTYLGYCGFNDADFESIYPWDYEYIYEIPGVQSIAYWLGPVKLSLYADIGFRAEFDLGKSTSQSAARSDFSLCRALDLLVLLARCRLEIVLKV